MIQQLLLSIGASAGGYDSDAQAFFTAAGITDTTQKDAVNQLVLDLKAASVWSLFSVIYPFVGGDATKHSYNLKNPSNYQITWNGTVTHSANGIQGDASTGYGNTNYNQNTHGTDDNEYLAVYNRTSSPTNNGYPLGVTDGTNQTALVFFPTSNIFRSRIQSSSNQDLSNSTWLGFFSGNRIGTAVHIGKNGTHTTATITNNQAKNNLNYFICARNFVGSIGSPTNANLAFACIGLGLTTTGSGAVYTAVQAYQTALSRNV